MTHIGGQLFLSFLLRFFLAFLYLFTDFPDLALVDIDEDRVCLVFLVGLAHDECLILSEADIGKGLRNLIEQHGLIKVAIFEAVAEVVVGIGCHVGHDLAGQLLHGTGFGLIQRISRSGGKKITVGGCLHLFHDGTSLFHILGRSRNNG